eukprot:9776441-Alexandrium_andersonii.AAC.1
MLREAQDPRMLRADQRINEHVAGRLRGNVEGQPARPKSSSSSSSDGGGGRARPPASERGAPPGARECECPGGARGLGAAGSAGCQSDGVSVAGEAVLPEDSTED